MYNLPAANISKSEISRIEHAWKAIMHRIYGVSTDGALNMVYAYTIAFLYVLKCYSGSAIF